MDNNCARCGRKVRRDDNWLKLHLSTGNAIFDWACFLALLRSNCPEAPEQNHRTPRRQVGNDHESE
jgi:hypothetical protein